MAKRNPSKQRRQQERRRERERLARRTERAAKPSVSARPDDTSDGEAKAITGRGRAQPAPATDVGAVGLRPVLLAFLLSVVTSITLLFLPVIENEDTGETETLIEVGGAALILVVVPVVLTGLAVLVRRSPLHRRRTWNSTAIAMLLWAAITPIGIFYLFAAGSLAYGAWQHHKAHRAAQAPAPDPPEADTT